MAHEKLAQLITLLRQANVKRYKTQTLEIEWGSPDTHSLGSVPVSVATSGGTLAMGTVTGADASTIHAIGDLSATPPLPTDLADDTMSYDQILNWSASPDLLDPKKQDQETLPLTGDLPL